MKAAVCYAFGEPLSVEEIELAPPQRGEVRVRLAATAICHSDLHTLDGEWAPRLPVVAGHEAAGVVEVVGEGVTQTQPGARVVVSLLRACGHCYFCARGDSYLCETKYALDRESRLRNASGESLIQGVYVGAFAEAVVVDQSQVVRVPDEMPLDRACLLACGVITGIGSAIHVAHVEPGSSVVVIGAGGVGLNAIQGAALAGAARILALDTLDNKLDAARTFGATDTINVGTEDVRARVRALTGGRGADVALVTVGSTAAFEQAQKLIRKGGTVVIAGLPQWTATAPVQVAEFGFSGQRILGSHMGSTRLAVDIPWLVDLYLQGRLKLDELVTARYPLERINEAIDSMRRGQALRNVIVFDQPA